MKPAYGRQAISERKMPATVRGRYKDESITGGSAAAHPMWNKTKTHV